MKRVIYMILGASLLAGATTSCSDFLDQESPSQTTKDFVLSDPTTLRAAMQNVYDVWRSDGSGAFYDFIVSATDMENQPEAYKSQINRWTTSYFYGWNANETARGPETFDPNGNGMYNSVWTSLYKIIGLSNNIINQMENASNYKDMMAQTAPSDLSQIYGEAITMRATLYYELTRRYGDLAYQTVAGSAATHLTNRDSLSECILKDLEKVIPLMYRDGESTVNKTYFNRTYAEGLVGRICLWEAGYQTRRTDMGESYYTDIEGKPLSFETVSKDATHQCFYGRRSDWKKFYTLAEKYLGDAIAKPGNIHLQTTDPRTEARYKEHPNPYQYVFQQNMMGVDTQNPTLADESVHEIPDTHANGNSERPYAFGRPSNGGSSNYYPCKSYGQSRFNPLYYYDMFDPNDMRRDVTCTVTGSDGHGCEALLNFTKGSRLNGGIALNKWDENRMAHPWTLKQRQSGTNNPYMRFSDIILMQAEVKAGLGKDAEAKQYLEEIRNRAFGSAAKANTDAYIAKQGSLLKAIINERGLEFGGEGSRKYDLIRTNLLDDVVTTFHQKASAMINDLKTKGYHRFDNGNEISNYVWTKKVDAKTAYGYRLTGQCPADKTDDPVLYPSWRGQNDDWDAVADYNGTKKSALTAGSMTNLAIKGLFKHIEPGSDEAKQLEAEGYTMQPWAITIWAVYDKNKKAYVEDLMAQKQYDYYIYNGYTVGQPPIYMLMMGGDIIKNSNGVLHNGYGFRDK